jgi:hypothetical protein
VQGSARGGGLDDFLRKSEEEDHADVVDDKMQGV